MAAASLTASGPLLAGGGCAPGRALLAAPDPRAVRSRAAPDTRPEGDVLRVCVCRAPCQLTTSTHLCPWDAEPKNSDMTTEKLDEKPMLGQTCRQLGAHCLTHHLALTLLSSCSIRDRLA